jgi:hypothetical protein
MKSLFIRLVLFGIIGGAVPLPGQDAGPLSGESAARLMKELEPAYAYALKVALTDLLSAEPVPRRALDIVLGGAKDSWFPPDPKEAAMAVLMAARDCDDAARRGIPMPVIKSRLHLEWRAVAENARELSLRQQERNGRELESFMTNGRRLGAQKRGTRGRPEPGRYM